MEIVEVMRVLGVTVSCGLVVSTHVNEVLATCASSLLCTSSAEGTWLSDKATVCMATAINCIVYTGPACMDGYLAFSLGGDKNYFTTQISDDLFRPKFQNS